MEDFFQPEQNVAIHDLCNCRQWRSALMYLHPFSWSTNHRRYN